MSRFKVLVVDDSFFMRKLVTDMISEDPQFDVVATAKDGLDAIEKAKRIKPDVITMDLEMPELNGLEALKVIMADNPVPVVMLSSLTEEGAAETIQALELGAIDFVRKPSGTISLDIYKVKLLLLEKLRMAVKTKVKPIQDRFPLTKPAVMKGKDQTGFRPENVSKFTHLVAIGTSTGGPRALQQVLSSIPEHFPAPILIVQHMPPHFTRSLAQRLDSLSAIRVVEAAEGSVLERATAYVAPGGWHMTVYLDSKLAYRIRLSQEAPRAGHRPSVDTLFESLVALQNIKRHIVLLTGMGSDGARGMLALKKDGAETTIAESVDTCIVYGMPRAAVELNCVTDLLPLHEIPGKLAQSVLT